MHGNAQVQYQDWNHPEECTEMSKAVMIASKVVIIIIAFMMIYSRFHIGRVLCLITTCTLSVSIVSSFAGLLAR